jgi:peroxiredoxin
MSHVPVKMTNWSLCFICMLLAFGCQPSENRKKFTSFAINGKLKNSGLDTIYLSAKSGSGFVIKDTTSADSLGNFYFYGTIDEPDIYRISLTPENAFQFVIDAPQLEVVADAGNLPETSQVKGSRESALLKAFMQIDEQYQREVARVEEGFIAARDAGNADSLIYYQEEFFELRKENARKQREFISENPDSFVAAYATYAALNREEEGEFADSMITVFNENIPDSKYVRLLRELHSKKSSVAEGSIAPDLTLPQPDGTMLTLSSLRGKYVLLDFWASWCRPCREENPSVVRLYKEYQKQGFEIFGVSLDESREQWVGAIEKDGLPWANVSDLKGAESEAARLYHVEAIPMTVLLDKEGRIMALNLRGPALKEKLDELFN